MNTDILIDNDGILRFANLVVFIFLSLAYIHSDYSASALVGLFVQAFINILGQVFISIKYQNYSFGPISSPFIGSELVSFSIIALVLSVSPIPVEPNISDMLILMIILVVFIVSSVLSYVWIVTGVTVLLFSVYYVDSEPFASLAGAIIVGGMLVTTYFNQWIINRLGQQFVKLSPVNQLSVGESQLEAEFVYGSELSENTGKLWYCRIPLDDDKWFTIKEESRQKLKDTLDAEPTDRDITQNSRCILCDKKKGVININHGVQCDKISSILSEASKSQICDSCLQNVFKDVLQDDSIEEFTSEEHLADKL